MTQRKKRVLLPLLVTTLVILFVISSVNTYPWLWRIVIHFFLLEFCNKCMAIKKCKFTRITFVKCVWPIMCICGLFLCLFDTQFLQVSFLFCLSHSTQCHNSTRLWWHTRTTTSYINSDMLIPNLDAKYLYDVAVLNKPVVTSFPIYVNPSATVST